MPGGGVARRRLRFVVMADCSGSMKGAKMQVSRMSEAGADRDALAQQLLPPEAVAGSGLDDDPIL